MSVVVARSPVPSLVIDPTSPLPHFDLHPLSNDSLSPNVVDSPKMMNTNTRHGQLGHTRSWPVQQSEESPARLSRPSIRERSSSQPQPGHLLEVVAEHQAKKRSNSMNRNGNISSPTPHVTLFPACGMGLDTRMNSQQLMHGESMHYEMRYV
ncbi:hypothetical protein P154DRAFT_328184 [Amniculicola lignicola CBS 123094]|uniref:Uncharacterized protein n=1 Tax=Amniculicola lignicola CBS 123094 TaxID=1392246 RepID=A0A6A5W2L0_9PLEO|nr:hypothetical protein P154DRAFT_328184 [Amniculicola lignicola CBS 123094]